MGDGTEKNPYAREDVLRLIQEHGGKAEGLDLSGKTFEACIDLSKCDLHGITLKKAVFKHGTVHPSGAHLEEADLSNAHLEGANLVDAQLRKARLYSSHLQGATLIGVVLSPDTELDQADWGRDFMLGGEGTDPDAPTAYRRLKAWYTTAGYYDIAAKFFFREMEARRKLIKRWSRKYFWERLELELSYRVFGYGERLKRITGWIAAVVLSFAGIDLIAGTLFPSWGTLQPGAWWDYLYYSAASFISLGYGNWFVVADGLVRMFGVIEAFLGFFMMTLLLVTFVRKWTR